MKKQYIRPASEAIDIECQAIMELSIGVNNETPADASTSFSNKGGWNSEGWEDSEEE